MAASGSNRNPEEDQPSSSPSRAERRKGPRRPNVLVVEDNRADVFLIRESIQSAHVNADLHVLDDGEKAMLFFDRLDQDPGAVCPDLVILDLNLPKRPGREVLEHIRRSSRCADAFVLVVTSSNSERDRDQMAELGVSVYFRKPSDYSEFMKLGGIVKGFFEDAAGISVD